MIGQLFFLPHTQIEQLSARLLSREDAVSIFQGIEAYMSDIILISNPLPESVSCVFEFQYTHTCNHFCNYFGIPKRDTLDARFRQLKQQKSPLQESCHQNGRNTEAVSISQPRTNRPKRTLRGAVRTTALAGGTKDMDVSPNTKGKGKGKAV